MKIDGFVLFCSEVNESKSSPDDLIVHKGQGYFKGKACKHSARPAKSGKKRAEAESVARN